MPKYQCRIRGDDDRIARLTLLQSGDGQGARQEMMTLIGKAQDFDGYELWEDGRMVDSYRSGKSWSKL
jgi:hypothetical protein